MKAKALTVKLPLQAHNELQKISDEAQSTMTDLLRRSLAVLCLTYAEQKQGNKLALSSADETNIREVVIFD